ncbi:MAG: RNA 2'-phosphotransferase [Hyphomicrobiales bacterium]
MGKTRSPHDLAKMLSYVLGRRPDEFGLVPDAEGFVRLKDLLRALHEEDGWGYVNLSHLNEVLLSVTNAPVEIVAGLIRARNRVASALEVPEPDPPRQLYVCVRRRAYPHVYAEGIRPSSHPRVVLASDRMLAERLGRRIDSDPVILAVNAPSALAQGITFVRLGESLYTAEAIPPDCFSGPPLPKEKPGEGRSTQPPEEAPRRPSTPGSFAMDLGKSASGHVPAFLKRRMEKGKKIDRKRLKREKWSREKPPWRN